MSEAKRTGGTRYWHVCGNCHWHVGTGEGKSLCFNAKSAYRACRADIGHSCGKWKANEFDDGDPRG